MYSREIYVIMNILVTIFLKYSTSTCIWLFYLSLYVHFVNVFTMNRVPCKKARHIYGRFKEKSYLHQDELKNTGGQLSLFLNSPWSKKLMQQWVEAILSPKNQRRPLHSLLYESFIYANHTLWKITSLLHTCKDNLKLNFV